MSCKKVIIDCDTGIDDALALTLACSSDKLDILGVTTVSGNVGIEDTTRNTCNVLHLLGRDDLKVARGAEKPLTRNVFKASGVHGATGLRGYDFDENHYELLIKDVSAWDYQYELLKNSEEKVVIIALGPLTNLAILFDKYPEIKDKIKEIVFMGTSYHCGNPTSLSTFNVLVDPEAFRKVIFSGVPFVGCSLDVTKTAIMNDEKVKEITAIGTKVSDFVSSILNNYGLTSLSEDEGIEFGEGEEVVSTERLKKAHQEGITLHDPATVGYVIAPELFTGNKYYCDVECSGELTLGYTVIDKEDYYLKPEEEKNILFLESINNEKFIDLFLDLVKKY